MQKDKYIPIHNEVAEGLAKINLSPYESRILWVIFRKTYGFIDRHGKRKKMDWIAYSQITEMTGGLDKRLISRSLKGLINKKVISRDDKMIGFSKQFMSKKSSVEMTDKTNSEVKPVISRDDKRSSILLQGGSSVEMYTKEKSLTKEKRNTHVAKEETPLQVVVNHYKVKTGYKKEDKTWNKAHFPRCSSSAKKLIDFCGSPELAIACIDGVAAEMGRKKLDWTIETIVKHSAKWKLEYQEKRELELKKQEETEKAEKFAQTMGAQ